MQRRFGVLMAVVALLLLARCGKEETVTGPSPKEGSRVLLAPSNLSPPPPGVVYEGWVVRLDSTASGLVPNYTSFGRFGWNSYVYSFVDGSTGQARSFSFETGQNLFTANAPSTLNADTARSLLARILRRDTLSLNSFSLSVAGLKVLLISVEPANETGADLTRPSSPFLAGFSNDSGVVELTYPVDYRNPDITATYFLGTPSDSLLPITIGTTDTGRINNESRGIWIGRLTVIRTADSNFVVPRLLSGWRYEGWIVKPPLTVSLGKFVRPDSADLSNPYADTTKIFQIPGEDFLINPPPGLTSVLGGLIVVSLEPHPDTDPAMFPLILFQDSTPLVAKTDQAVFVQQPRNFAIRSRFFPKVKARATAE